METRFSKESSWDKKNSSSTTTSIQKQMVSTGINNRRLISSQPDVADLLDDWFFGNVTNRELGNNKDHNPYTPTPRRFEEDTDDEGGNKEQKKLTQEWVHEAKRLVSASPARTCDSPTRLVGSPRFASAGGGSRDFLDRRDPLSRSARRHRAVESFSGEILSKSARHSRNKSETIELSKPTAEASPASALHQRFSNIFNPQHNQQRQQESSDNDQPDSIISKPPRQPLVRKSRFRDDLPTTDTCTKPNLSRRTFKSNNSVPSSPNVLSPPRNLIESVHRRTNSSSTCALPEIQLLLSPPRNLFESTHRRSISSSTCSLDKFSLRPDSNIKEVVKGHGNRDLNGFLDEQRSNIARISNGDSDARAKFVLSGSSNSTSSMVATICYAWLLANTSKCNTDQGDATWQVVVVPVMNMKRNCMWKQKQVAWLFHHFGIDATSLLFSDEVDVEALTMRKQLSTVVTGQDVLRANGEVGSQCTILTDNYCEDAYDLLQVPILKNLLLAGILLDTQNLNSTATLCTNRDAEAVQLLLVGSSTNYRNALFDLLMQEQRDSSFVEALRQNYGKSPSRSDHENGETTDQRVSTISGISNKNENDARNVNKTVRVSPKLAPARTPEANHGKNKFFLAKWFGLGPKS
ncbi:hypothetical protein C5167_006076 [Papaver somniferum]|uniref:DHHA2 domain-containing protein n=1 Tax=Papaver somniferum TaxID=3469 RepID=A0A4Y7JFI1_PAPSO|nr:uncharacterized protein LOC113274073 [Papaver somniferum]RZC58770.1 hypothetical protein C5167_006076 [Papaver somniferum]